MNRERPDNPGVHVPPPLFFLVFLTLGILIDKWYPLALLPASWRMGQVIGGWGLIGLAGLLGPWAMITFARRRTAIFPNQPASALVAWGPYRFSRNPMYIAMSALHLGVSMLVNTLWSVLLLPAVWWLLYLLVIRREERYLTRAFGAEYEAYCQRVRRWL